MHICVMLAWPALFFLQHVKIKFSNVSCMERYVAHRCMDSAMKSFWDIAEHGFPINFLHTLEKETINHKIYFHLFDACSCSSEDSFFM